MTRLTGVVQFRNMLRFESNTVSNRAKRIAFNFISAVVFDTAVRTGLARNNWQFAYRTPPPGIQPDPDPTGGIAITLMRANLNKPMTRVGYLANNLPYIYPLEYEAWSRQSPDGMVRKNEYLLNG